MVENQSENNQTSAPLVLGPSQLLLLASLLQALLYFAASLFALLLLLQCNTSSAGRATCFRLLHGEAVIGKQSVERPLLLEKALVLKGAAARHNAAKTSCPALLRLKLAHNSHLVIVHLQGSTDIAANSILEQRL